jgi:hypothetical protein
MGKGHFCRLGGKWANLTDGTQAEISPDDLLVDSLRTPNERFKLGAGAVTPQFRQLPLNHPRDHFNALT